MYNWNQFNRRQTDSTFSNEKRKENYGWNPEEVLLLLLADKGPRDSCVNFVISLVIALEHFHFSRHFAWSKCF